MTGLPSTADANPAQVAGGSSAGRAYREELARQGRALGDANTQAPVTPQSKGMPAGQSVEARAAVRKKVVGRARVGLPGGAVVAGRMIDISLTGACILMEDGLPSKWVCSLEFDVFHDGKRYVFGAQAVSVYSVLASGKGFKVGFEFGPRGPAAQSAIAALVA